jgi:uncharacterized protein
MSQPFILYRLQTIDSQLDRIRTRLQRIEAVLQDDRQVEAAQEETDKAEQALQEARRLLKQAEENVHAQRMKIEFSESSLYGGKVRNPKELQDLQNEVASLKRYLSVLEDRQLDQMIAVEEAESVWSSASFNLDQVLASQSTRHGSLIDERAALSKELATLQNERDATTRSLDSDSMELYEQLRRQRMGVAVAQVVDKACAACGSTLTPSTVQNAHLPQQITRCTFCGRILYAG